MRSATALVLFSILGGALLPSELHAQTTSSVTLIWTATGDDSLIGRASQYDLRYSTSAITATNFTAATRWTTVMAPSTSGATDSAVVTGLLPGTTYWFALKVADEVPNWSGISNVISVTTAAPDIIRPAPVTTVAITGSTETSASVRWTAVGDDSLAGTATTNDVRYSTSPITAANWGSASQASGEPAPTASGTQQNFTINGLTRQTTYYVAMKVADEAGNWSAISNVASVTTPDLTRPAAIRDLTVGFLWLGWHAGIAADDATAPLAILSREHRRR